MMWTKIFLFTSYYIVSFLIFYYIFFAIDSVRMQSTARTSLAMAYTLMMMMMIMMMMMMMNMFAILTMSMRNMLAILMLFHLDIPNIALFLSMVVDLADLVTRDGIPCARSIFDVYIVLHDPCLITRNRNLRLKEKKLYTLFIYTGSGKMIFHILHRHCARTTEERGSLA